MRAWMLITVLVATSLGCTSVQLRRNTVRQVTTLTDLQHKLVLDNLAAFTCNPNAIPFQAKLVNGTTQVADSANASVSYLTEIAATLGISRSFVDQWGLIPVTDETTLRLLRIAYRRALGFDEDLYTDDFANILAHRLKAQIVTAPDVGVENTIIFGRGPALPQLLDRAGWRGDTRAGFPANDPAVERWQKDTTDLIASNSDRIIQFGERLTADNLHVTPVYADGAPMRALQGENSIRVKIATPYAAEIRRQIFALNNYLLEIHDGWFDQGCKKNVPRCVCYVGHRKDCDCNTYVWVYPESRRAFEDFTLRTLRLASMMAEPNAATPPSGIMFSPAVVH